MFTTLLPLGTGASSSSVVLIADNACSGAKNITVDGVPVPASAWQDFAGGKYSFQRYPLPSLTITHKVINTSSAHFGFYISFVAAAESYITQGGGTPYPVARMAVPLELLSFNIKPEKKNIRVEWNTSEEKSISHYQLERSSDGVNFFQIFQDKSTKERGGYHSFVDKNPPKGICYYRLVAITTQGERKNLELRSTEVKSSLTLENVVCKENQLNIKFSGIQGSKVNYRILDVRGVEVQKGLLNVESDEISDAVLNVETLLPGSYFIRIYQNSESDPGEITGRFIK